MINFSSEVTVVSITKKERDDLRLFNIKMRKLLIDLASTSSLDSPSIIKLQFEAHKLIVEQIMAGFKD